MKGEFSGLYPPSPNQPEKPHPTAITIAKHSNSYILHVLVYSKSTVHLSGEPQPTGCLVILCLMVHHTCCRA